MPTGPNSGFANLGRKKTARVPDRGEEHRVNTLGIIDTHTVGSDDTAVVLLRKLDDRLLHG